MKLIPYLIFGGNAADALLFYKEVLEGTISMMSRFGDSPVPCDEDWKQKIMHARLQFGEQNILMISDAMKGNTVSTQGNIQLSLGLSDETKTKALFDKLSEGGQVSMPLEKQFWGDLFGMLTDKFGVRWMLNAEAKK